TGVPAPIVVERDTFPGLPAVGDLQGDELAQQCRSVWLGHQFQGILNERPLPRLPSLLEAVASSVYSPYSGGAERGALLGEYGRASRCPVGRSLCSLRRALRISVSVSLTLRRCWRSCGRFGWALRISVSISLTPSRLRTATLGFCLRSHSV